MRQKILFLTTNLPGGSAIADVLKYRASILYVVQFFTKDDFQLTIKLHPAEQLNYYQLLLEKFIKKITILQTCNLYKLINEHEIVIGFPTTALLEARKLGKKCYYINPWKTTLPYPFDEPPKDNICESILTELKDTYYFTETSNNITDIINTILLSKNE